MGLLDYSFKNKLIKKENVFNNSINTDRTNDNRYKIKLPKKISKNNRLIVKHNPEIKNLRKKTEDLLKEKRIKYPIYKYHNKKINKTNTLNNIRPHSPPSILENSDFSNYSLRLKNNESEISFKSNSKEINGYSNINK